MADAAATCMGNLVADRKSLSTLKKRARNYLDLEINGFLVQMGQDIMVMGDMELVNL